MKKMLLSVLIFAIVVVATMFVTGKLKSAPVDFTVEKTQSVDDDRDLLALKMEQDEKKGVVSQNTIFSTTSLLSYTKPSKEDLKQLLTSQQYKVTQENGTEIPYTSNLNDNKTEGVYVDIVSGEPLFSSKDKYDSGTGWPSFVKPITPNAVNFVEDKEFLEVRTEVRSKYADSHLGHVFDDGPKDRGGKRYCMNGVALRFIPKDQMEKLGYGDYIKYL